MREPIAIVGIGCRFPGDVDHPEALVSLLRDKRSAIRDVPADRWNAEAFFHPDFRKPGSIHVRRGGFISGVDRFDAAFFGISPTEAKRMDPQQRHALETAYLAIEDAGLTLERLAGTSVAVTMGAGTSDYGGIVRAATERANIAGSTNPGAALSIISNRISYLFDLRGPSYTVDTACSSSLTALHGACSAIWTGMATAAICGGVNLVMAPETTIGFSKGGYLSPDAECRAFSDDANGYVRSEGAASVFLKPLSKALSDGDRIYAVVRGTWINQDGRTPGMTVPSTRAQEELLRSAWREAGVEPARAAYIEAHGTGTPAGDPLEANAIGNVVGAASGRRDLCLIGSVKPNIGHMECAAGMGGLVKLALTLQKRTVFPNINFRRANPKIDMESLGIRVPTECAPLPASGPVFGGVNSFGFGGANGHAVLETPPEPSRRRSFSGFGGGAVAPSPPVHGVLVTARSVEALKTYARAISAHVQSSETPVEEIARALVQRKSRFEFRLGGVVQSRDELCQALDMFAESAAAPVGFVLGRAMEGRDDRPAFVYTGQGAQWFAMGRTLLGTNDVFRDVVVRVERELAKLGWTGLRDELLRSRESSRMGETRIAQPCIFALQAGLTAALAARGIVPGAVVGHSIGELAAAYAAGALSLEEAARVVFWRSQCQAAAEGKGAMLAVGLTERRARELIGSRRDVEIAAFNGPSALTLAGTHQAIDALLEVLVAEGTFARRLDVSVPFHSWLMDPIEADFRSSLGKVQCGPQKVRFYSTVSGGAFDAALDADYWWKNIREPVRYQQALKAMVKGGQLCFLEVGPHPALMSGSLEIMREAGARGFYVPTLRRDGDDHRELAMAEASLMAHGAHFEPRELDAPHVELPAYPLTRERYWIETDAGRHARVTPVAEIHPHLGAFERSVHSPDTFSTQLLLDPHVEPYLADHRAQGHIVFPAAGQLELVVAAARHVYGSDAFCIEGMELRRPMVLAEDEHASASHRLELYADDGHFLIVSSSGKADAPWIEHTKGQVRRSRHPESRRVDLAALRARLTVEISGTGFYRGCETVGLELGPSFRNLGECRRDEARHEILCAIESVGVSAHDRARFLFHPALLDVAAHAVLPIEPERSAQRLFLPYRIGNARFFGPTPTGRIWSHARYRSTATDTLSLDIDVFDEDGHVFACIGGLEARLVRGSGNEQPLAAVQFDHGWHEKPMPLEHARDAAEETWLVLASARGTDVGRAVERRLTELRRRVVRVFVGAKLAELEPHVFEVEPGMREQFAAVLDSVNQKIAGVVDLWSLDLAASVGPEESARLGAVAMGDLVSTLTARNGWSPERREAWLVTAGAACVTAADVAVCAGSATFLGFGRTLASENPRLDVTLVDIGASWTTPETSALAEEVARGPSDAEIAFRGDLRFCRSLSRTELREVERPLRIEEHALRAVARTAGVLDSIALEEYFAPELGPDAVEVDVRAVGLNFRDVVAAMNMLPPDAWEGGLIGGQQLGLDASGVVRRVGASVTRIAVGDRVLGFFPHSLATRAVSLERHLAKLPPGISMTDAAALPTPYITADIALHELARLRAGETVLIHAAAGGVGVIAVQLALAHGATVIATCGSDEKRQFLEGLGVKYIFGSRSSDFGDDVMRVTGGAGVDVVLNSLAGRAMSESFRCLKPFGRFVEIGKTDVYRNRQIGLRQFGENKSYFCLDINRLYMRPDLDVAAMLTAAMEARTSGAVPVLPVRTFPLAESATAMRHLAQAKQIGRVVVEVPESGELMAQPSSQLRLDPGATYLLTGGCSGFGLALAEWLVEKGARSLVLAGRRGLPGAVEEQKVRALQERGVRVDVEKVDVGTRADVDRLIASAANHGRLAGVFHLAMVLDDGAIDALSQERYARVLRPKAEGALHLHHATLAHTLDHFVLFSSIASVLGTPGQANYAAANAFLDELARTRHAAGLPGTSINWGVIDDVGVVARSSSAQRRRILGQGVRAMSSRRAFEVLERVLHERPAQRMIADLDPKLLGKLGGAARRFDAALRSGGADHRDTSSASLRETLRAAPEEAQPGILADALARIVSSVAGVQDGQIDRDASLGRYGLDSLMVAQLQTWIEEQLGLAVAMVRLLRGPAISELAAELALQLAGASNSGDSDGRLFHSIKTVAKPRFRFVCFAPMAMDAEAFAVLADALPADIAVDVLQAPTFSEDAGGFLVKSPEEQAALLLGELGQMGLVPFAFYGHSLGAYVALTVARSLSAAAAPMPAFVVLGAVPAPDSSETARTVFSSPDEITDEMAEAALPRLNGAGALTGPGRARIVELARRDLWLSSRGDTPDASVPRGQMALLLSGEGDPLATLDKLPEGALSKLGYARASRVPGGHLFLLDAAGARCTATLFSELAAAALGEDSVA